MFKILLARQGQTMEQGTMVRWMIGSGEAMRVGEELYEIETEKSIVPIEATRPGRIVRFVARPGDTVQVGATLAIAAEPDEEATEQQIDALLAGVSHDTAPRSATSSSASQASPMHAQPRRDTKVAVMPKARALAAELGVNLADVSGSGPEGTIVVDDVRRAARTVEGRRAADVGTARKVPLSPVARSTVAALERAWHVPQFTQGIHIDASALVRAKSASADCGFTDYFLDAMIRAAREVPEVLARLLGTEVEFRDTIDVTIATATEHGLLVPVLRDAGAHDMMARKDVWRALVERARAGKLSVDEASNGIIALSNLGTRGVDYGTPLLPVGHSLIVFVGSLETRPLVVDDRLEARPSLHVAVTYDHRVIDGVLGARYTGALRSALLAP
jgi:pyruvate dehydrogenase E2 component (dihydrolipoamide acetyltransferase)